MNECCFIYALQQTGEYNDDELNQMRLRIKNRYLPQSTINQICEEFNIHIKLSYIDEEADSCKKRRNITSKNDGEMKKFLGVDEDKAKHVHKLAIYNTHYFLDEITPFSTYYIKHLSEGIKDKYYNKHYDSSMKSWRTCDNKKRPFITSSNMVRELMKQGFFHPITFAEYGVLKTTLYNDVDKDIKTLDLNYNPKFCVQLMKPIEKKNDDEDKKKNDKPMQYFYADFEADTTTDIHKPYFVNVQSVDGDESKMRSFQGSDCGVQLLEYLPHNCVVIFHNLAYDVRMIAKYGIVKSTMKNGVCFKADIKYKNKSIHFKDTYPILNSKLSEFPKMFNIKGIQKEIFPYNYYTLERLNNDEAVGVINEAGINEAKPWNEDDYKLFNENIDKIKGCRVDDNHFDMWKYCEFYCKQDVNILRQGFNTFRDGLMNELNLDPFHLLTTPQMANEYFCREVFNPNGNLYMVGGHIRHFLSKAIHGGRCMTAYNKKWHIKKNIVDYDAVSLYPSAMKRLYTVEGMPKPIPKDKLCLDFLKQQTAYVVLIEITKINKHYAFPLVRKGYYCSTYDDQLKDGETRLDVVSDIELEDLINFQQIEFNIINGLYWDGAKDYRIQEVIQKVFDKRLEYKKQNNPLQLIYKLIMNSAYGKSIQRPIDNDIKYIKDGDELMKYKLKNYNKIIEDIELEGCDIHAVKTIKPIDKHFNNSLFGIHVLAMSKRIMNEVMCLAFDLGCHVYYQDSDSIHIELDDLPKLENAFRAKYGRELRGSNLGQFHSDFPTINGHKETPYAIESLFLMKKMYIDKLTDSSNEIDYMMRGKGITQESIKYVIENEFNNNPMALYEHIFNGNTQTFDLTKGKPAFDMKNNMSITTREHFERRIKTNYVEGKREEYFNYANVIEEDDDDIEPDETALDKIVEEDMKEHDELIASFEDKPLKTLFKERFHMTFNDVKHGTRIGRDVNDEFIYHQTGMNLMVNQVHKGFTVIDIDINKELDVSQRVIIRNKLLSMLSIDDIIVESGSGSLHVYCIHDLPDAYKNAYVEIYKCEEYSIDYITSYRYDKQATIMLPRSLNSKGRYQFLQGNYESTIKRTSSDVLRDIDVKLNLAPRMKKQIDDEAVHECNLTNEYQNLLVEGLTFDVDIHANSRDVNNSLSIYNLFTAFNVLNDEHKQLAYNKILKCGRLTSKARELFNEKIELCKNKTSSLGTLIYIIKKYNKRYFDEVLSKYNKNKHIDDDDISEYIY